MHSVDIRIRIAIVLGLVLLCTFLIYPIDESINLGLDLKGGIHIVMRVKTDDALKAELDLSGERVRSVLAEKGLVPQSIERAGTDSVLLSGFDEAKIDEARSTIREQFPQFTVAAAGASGLRMVMRPEEMTAIRDSTVRQSLETIRNRVDKFGVAEPTIQRQGVGPEADRILIQLPGVDDPERVKDLIGSPAYLEWKIVKIPPGITVEQFSPPPSPDIIISQFGGTLPGDVEILPGERELGDGTKVLVYYPVTRLSPITGADLQDSRRDQDQFGSPSVSFRLTGDAGRRFQELTRENQGQLLAIVLDRKIISAPVIRAVIAEQGQIDGNYSLESAEDLALKLRSGALPAGMEILEERTVGPSLGADSVRQGAVASIIGSIIVVLFMVIYYRFSGLNATLALFVNLLILLGAMSYFRATLTLPGIAGIALTVGMAVDANVLVFERIREELRLGRTPKAAVHSGFAKALSTVVDSNLTTLIAAFVLLNAGTGPVRGFAVTLSVGILANLFTAVFMSRVLFDALLTLRPKLGRLSI